MCIFFYHPHEDRKVVLLLQSTISGSGSISKIARTLITITLFCFYLHSTFSLSLFFSLLIFYAPPNPSSGPEPVAVTEKGLNKLLVKATHLISVADGKHQESRSRHCSPLSRGRQGACSINMQKEKRKQGREGVKTSEGKRL